MPKVKLIIIAIFLVLFAGTIFAFLKVSTASFDQKFSAYVAWFNPTDANINNYLKVSESPAYLNTIDASGKTFKSNEEVFDFFREKSKTSSQPIYSVLKTPREAKVPIPFSEEKGIDINLPEKISYVTPGVDGYQDYSYDLLLFSPSKDVLSSKYLNLNYKVVDPISKKTLTGGKKTDNAKKDVTTMFTTLIKNLNDKTTLKEKGIDLNDANLTKIDNKEVLQNISINSISFLEKDFKEDDLKNSKNKLLTIGTINIHLENCFKDFSQDLVFSVAEDEIKLSDVNPLVGTLCKIQFVKINGVLTGTCVDCTFYPADKNHALRADYAPNLSEISEAPGLQLASAAYPDFVAMYNAAKNDGVFILVTSAYRSYQTQQATFQDWVQTELDAGYSQDQAVVLANNFSAIPGFSEHQLGTAMDLDGVGCSAFVDCSSNETVWNWLSQNAYKYGFIQSYPDGKMTETGYTTEAWHYRWIGKDLASEYKNAGGGTALTLNQFLLDKGNY